MAGGGSSLRHISPQSIVKFVHHVIDNLYGGSDMPYQKYSSCPLDKFWAAIQEVKSLCREVTKEKMTKEEVVARLADLDTKLAEEVYDAICGRRVQIDDSLLQDALQGKNTLTDFDWNVKLAVSSDKILDLNEALLTLHLHTANAAESCSDISTELTAAQVDELLAKLRGAQEVLQHQLPG